jgi:exonuclease SbcC
MKLAHIADLHCSKEHAEEALTSLRFFAEHIKTSPVDLVCIAGDVWDASILNTEASGYNRFTDAIREIADLAPAAMIYGTPSHDTDGSLEVFRKIACNYGITILEPGQAYFLHHGVLDPEDEEYIHFITGKNDPAEGKPDAVLFGIPEPRKKYLLAGESTGKDETEEAVRDAVRRLCFSLAAKRREYPDIPCVALYHGDVAGSVLQNDRTVERGTGISITVDDLADIGADYYALGHIHKPQRAGNLPAYYAGSIYPKNFGETHQAGFNVVTLHDGEYLLERVDFPHPRNLKIETGYADEIPWEEVKGRRVWIEVTCTREERARFDPDETLGSLICCGAAPGSRVTVNEPPVETVRAGEIAEASTPEKKFEIWAENAQQNIHLLRDKLFSKIGELRERLTESGGNISGEWSLVSVRLRGAAGIRKGIGKEEIAVNFDKYDEGLIALCGANGKGKTTLIENCHPYPQLLTRKGKLQDHFYLRDSFREVVYRNRKDGRALRFLIQIDGQNKSGSCKYFIFRNFDSDGNWTPVHGVDGNLKPYEEFVRSVFGPLELFLRTAFTTQRPNRAAPDLTEATAGEKKALFAELAGIEYLQRFAEGALERRGAEQARAHDAELQALMLEQAAAEKPEIEREIRDRKETLAANKKDMEDIAEKGRLARAEVERLSADAEKERDREGRERRARESAGELERGLVSDRDILEKYGELVKNRAAYEEEALMWDHYAAVISAETETKQQVLEENLRKQREFSRIRQEYQRKVRETEQGKQQVMDSFQDLERLIQAGESKISLLERDAQAFETSCPTCGQELPEDKLRELSEKRNLASLAIAECRKEIAGIRENQASRKKTLDQITQFIAALAFAEPEPEADEPFDDTALREARAAQGGINIAGVREALVKAAEAGARIEQLSAAIAANGKSLEERKAELAELEAAANPGIIRDLDEARTKHAGLTENYTSAREAIARNEAELAARKERLAELEAREAELGTLRETLEAAKAEGAEWDLIARGFGRDGIQALELDALAPGIAETANRILAGAYGDRFRIEIRTTRTGGAGKKTKQIEDFLIYVIDAADGEAVLLDDKSGGEAVWIKRAIYDAFAVIRKRNTGFAFLTCFQDEADGALDGAAKTAYFRMLEAAHAASGMRHTVIITHSEEVKAMIPQKIDMEDL